MKLCDRDSCTGCEVCSIVCPTKSITMKQDQLGFFYPEINHATCIDCHRCTKKCHVLNVSHQTGNNQSKAKKIYAVWHADMNVRMKSTSGGAFSALAEVVLAKGGCVVGAVYDENFAVVHQVAYNQDELNAQRGSKYVQSRINGVLRKVKELVRTRQVLFCGTPCQIAAVNHFVGHTNNLFTVDIVCHGVGAPRIFHQYLDYLAEQHHAKVKEFRFRNKLNSWRYPSVSAEFDNDQKYFRSGLIDPMFVGFNKDIFQRESCFQCKYTNLDRPSDITISDFWGYESLTADDLDDDYGISMLMVNTEQGEMLFTEAKDRMVVHERGLKQAMNGQPCLDHPTAKSPRRDEFMAELDERFDVLAEKYFQPRYEFSSYYYYRANHTRDKSRQMKSAFRVIDGIARRLHVQKAVIHYIERKKQK